MSRSKIAFVAVPACLVLILSFQNCGGPNFDTLPTAGSDNLGSATPPVPSDPSNPGTPQPTPPLPGNPPPPVTPPADDAGRRILKVCASGCAYTLPSQAVAASANDDIIEVAAGSYNDCFTVTKNNIKFRGMNGRAHLTGKICNSKGSFNITGKNIVIENFEFSGMSNADGNGSGIRHQGTGLIVRNSYFHDGQEGILSEGATPGAPDDTILIENSKFERLGTGGGGYAHAVYFGHHFQVTIRNSQFLSSRDQGHEFKCRAQNVLINCSHMASLEGVDSYSVNFPEGGNVEITNSVIEQGTASSNSGIVDFGSEMSVPFRYSNHQLNLTNVALINDRGSGTYFVVRNSNKFTVNNSSLIGGGTLFSQNTGTFNNVQQHPSRAAAGLSAYPSLPTPAGCSNIGLTY